MYCTNKRINAKENAHLYTEEQLKAIETAHNSFFYAAMSDDSRRTREEEYEALETLKKAIPEIIAFKPDFYGNGDILVYELYIDLKNSTVKELANAIDENYDILLDLMRDCGTCSYTNDPYDTVRTKVFNANINHYYNDVISKYIYNNLYNN